VNYKARAQSRMRSQTHEITFVGQVGVTLRAEFDDCAITTGPDTTILRAQVPDQGALMGLVQRINGLGLEVVDLDLVTPPPE
jgi:hypothetical protein